MNKTKIEWCDYTANLVKGYCPVGCVYCYARRMYDRFGWDKTIREDMAGWYKGVDIREVKQPARIFVGSTIELFHDSIPELYIRGIFSRAWYYKQHTFIFLTKQPQNLVKFSPFPENCWVGQSLTGHECDLLDRLRYFSDTRASVRFISFEPLLTQPELKGTLVNRFGKWHKWTDVINWVIIGSETGNRRGKPPLEQVQGWAKEIIAAADEAGVPVFLKDNLKWPVKRQEWPLTKLVGGDMKSNELTEYEKQALEGAKKLGWFDPESLDVDWYIDRKPWSPGVRVRRPYYVASKLRDKGFMRDRFAIQPMSHLEFRVKEVQI